MPVCYLTFNSNKSYPNDKKRLEIRKIIARNLITSNRFLDEKHIVLRIQHSEQEDMLGEVELDIFAQFYFKRYFNRDKRANAISRAVSEILNMDCATWINLSMVGYSRVTADGKEYFSD